MARSIKNGTHTRDSYCQAVEERLSALMDTTIDERQFRIATGYRGAGGQPAARRDPSPGTRAAAATAPAVPAAAGAANAAQPTTSEIAQGGGAVCPCCA